MDSIIDAWPSGLLIIVGVAAGVLLAWLVIWRLVLRLMKDRALADDLRSHLRWPARVVVVLATLVLGLSEVRLARPLYGTLFRVLLLVLVAAGAWLAVRAVRVAEDALMRRYDVEVPDNLRARRARTQIQVLGRVVQVAIVVLALAFMLLTLPPARAIGTSLLASAGIVGIIAGVAARSTVGNLIAGLQIAFAEPIRLDDAVVVEGEWGNIEEITLTYVVVRIWDRRRLVLPCSYFVERPIQNWTRYSADIVGTVLLHVDYTTPVQEVRAEFEQVLAASKLWNGQTAVLQVVDTTERTMVLRALVSADSAPSAWDLRCEVRERLLAWLQQQQPGALPRVRAELEAPAPQQREAPAPSGPDQDDAAWRSRSWMQPRCRGD
jgi:small-conductance mechanosensitive channel